MSNLEETLDALLDQVVGPMLEKVFSRRQSGEAEFEILHTAEAMGETIPTHCQRIAMVTRRLYHLRKDLSVIEMAHHEAPQSCVWILRDMATQAYELHTEIEHCIAAINDYEQQLHNRREDLKNQEAMREARRKQAFDKAFSFTTPTTDEQRGNVPVDDELAESQS